MVLSRVRNFTNVGLKNVIRRNRFCRAIKKHAKVKGRISEEKLLQILCENTLNDFNRQNGYNYYLAIDNFLLTRHFASLLVLGTAY